MNILFLSTWFPFPLDNGSKIRVYHLLEALGVAHQVTLLAFAFGTSAPEKASVLRQSCAEIQVVNINPFDRGWVTQALRFLSPRPIVTHPIPEMVQLAQKLQKQTAFDVVIASTHVMTPYALLATSSAKVLEEHNSLTRWMKQRYQEQSTTLTRLRCWISWQKTRFYECQTLRRFDLCTMVSEQDLQATRELLPNSQGKIEIVSNGVDCQHNYPELAPKKSLQLVFNGALTYSANYDAIQFFLNEIYPHIKQQVPQVTLHITGSLEDVDLTSLRLDPSVQLTGYLEDVRSLVASSTVCIVPIRQGGGTRIKILEAMALGTPVVTTSKGAEGLEVIPERDILLADEPIPFATQAIRLLGDPVLRTHLAENARRLVEKRYDWRKIGRRFVGLVESTAKHRGLV